MQVCDDGMDSSEKGGMDSSEKGGMDSSEKGDSDGSSGSDEDDVYGITTVLNLSHHKVRIVVNLLQEQHILTVKLSVADSNYTGSF